MRPFKACGGFLPAGRRFRTCAGNWAPPLCGSAYGRRRLEGTVVTTVGSAPPPSRHRRPRALGQKTAGGKPKGQGHGGNGQQAGVGRPPQNHREQPRRRRRLLSFPTETGVMLAPEGARWLQGMAWRLNGLQAWAAQAIGARASDVRRSHRIQNGFVQSRNGACAQVFELSRERLCWCLSGA